MEALPVFIRHIADGRTLWRHGQIDGLPVKIGAPDDPSNFEPVNPDTIDRIVHEADVRVARETVSRYLSGVDLDPASSSVCMITLSRDLQFLLGPRGRGSAISLAGGCSGHAFKHAPSSVLPRERKPADIWPEQYHAPFDTTAWEPTWMTGLRN
jgi:sarcosine oxidase